MKIDGSVGSNWRAIYDDETVCRIVSDALSVFAGSSVIVESPDRSPESQHLVESLSAAGIRGVWRVRRSTGLFTDTEK